MKLKDPRFQDMGQIRPFCSSYKIAKEDRPINLWPFIFLLLTMGIFYSTLFTMSDTNKKEDFWDITERWIQVVEQRYEGLDRDDLTQVFMRGPFAGMSERELACFVDRLRQASKDYPLSYK